MKKETCRCENQPFRKLVADFHDSEIARLSILVEELRKTVCVMGKLIGCNNVNLNDEWYESFIKEKMCLGGKDEQAQQKVVQTK